MATRPWLGENDLFTVVDTPGFADSDNDDSELVDEMMTVLNKDVGTANLILLVIKGTETRLSRDLQQMIREMRALFGEHMWNNLVIGVSFWSFKSDLVNYRENTCQWSPANCRNEQWFEKSMKDILKDKFHIKQDFPFVFLDSWAKHPMNINDGEQKQKFDRESKKLWMLAKRAKPFNFMTVNDVLEENHVIKKRNAELEDMIKMDIREMKKSLDENDSNFNGILSRLEKLTDKSKEHGDKSNQLQDMITQFKASTSSSINQVQDNVELNIEKVQTKVSNAENKILKEVSQLENGFNHIFQNLAELKQESHSFQKSLSNEILERRNLNSVFRKDISINTKEVASLHSKSAVLDKDLSFLNKSLTEQKVGQDQLKSSLAGFTKHFSKLRNSVMTRRNCQSTDWVNNFDYPLNYKCPGNKVLVRAESYHTNKTEDMRWKFECCDLMLSFDLRGLKYLYFFLK